MRGHVSSRQAALGGIKGGIHNLSSALLTVHQPVGTAPLAATHSLLGHRRLFCRASALPGRAGPPRAACRDMMRHGGTTTSLPATAACLGTARRGERCAPVVSATRQLYCHRSSQIANPAVDVRTCANVQNMSGMTTAGAKACLLSIRVGQ